MEPSENKIPVYVLRLYISGATPNSAKAIRNIKSICNKHLKDRYKLTIVDIYKQPAIAESEQIIAIPTLVKSFPLPLKKMIGNMSDVNRVLKGLELD